MAAGLEIKMKSDISIYGCRVRRTQLSLPYPHTLVVATLPTLPHPTRYTLHKTPSLPRPVTLCVQYVWGGGGGGRLEEVNHTSGGVGLTPLTLRTQLISPTVTLSVVYIWDCLCCKTVWGEVRWSYIWI